MPEQTPTVGMERKLAAIFSTDVAGYSRLMGDDEEATIRTLTRNRAIISSLTQHYGASGRFTGDNRWLSSPVWWMLSAVQSKFNRLSKRKTLNCLLIARCSFVLASTWVM